jgi:CheY-like chemotaxis protein
VTAVNGTDALEAVRRQRFDVVLMDVQMPGMDGIATTGVIRGIESSRGGHLPILALTAHAMAADRERCLGAGMDGFLVKPIRPAALLEAVERLGAGVAEQPEPDRVTLLDEVGGDAGLLDEICDLFARESAVQVIAVRQAIESVDADLFAGAVHTLRGMLRSVRARAAEQLATALGAVDLRAHQAQARAQLLSLEQAIAALRERFTGAPEPAEEPPESVAREPRTEDSGTHV